jgi:predicted nucleotidyltransferase
MDEGLLHRAWDAAYEVATHLYAQFDTIQVVVFGSLTEPMWFTNESDIDIAVSGLSEEDYDKAWEVVMDFDSGFKMDIINFDTSKGLFRERIKHQAIPIEKGTLPSRGMRDIWQTLYKHLQQQVFPIDDGEIYEMNRKRLTQRINDELDKIDGTLERIHRGLEKIEEVPIDVTEFIENTIATDLADIYNGIERIFERIAREVDMLMPTGSRWHKNLLAQMAEKRPERRPVISENTRRELEELLEFRHVVNNIYGRELKYEKTIPHAKSIDELFERVSEDMNRFTDSLVRPEEDV